MNTNTAELRYTHRPSTIGYMLRAFHRTPGLDRVTGFPRLSARWLGQRVDAEHRAAFAELTGLRDWSRGAGVLYPHVLGFPLQMAILTHTRFPVPIWRVLQIRNQLLQHRPLELDERLDWHTRVCAHRFLVKGAEVDLHTAVRSRGELAWEGLTTYYIRGPVRGSDAAPELATPPVVADAPVASWHMPAGVGWRFAGLTGDFNGIHIWDWYARRFGFRRAFHHPQLAVGQCLARLPAPDTVRQRLDLWLKGPVFYDTDVRLSGRREHGAAVFALHVDGDERPAIIGRWHAGAGHATLNKDG